MGVFDRQTATALRLIKAKGELIVWKSAAVPTVPDSSKPWLKQDGEPATNSASIVWVSSFESYTQLNAGSEVESGGLKGIMHAVSFVPDLKDTIIRKDGTKLQLESLTPLNPNGEVILWRVATKR